MFSGYVTVKTTKQEKAEELGRILKDLAKREVYVGIPEAKAGRKSKVNNAQLLFIHTHGSPIKNIPARPVIEPAIEAPENKDRIAKYLAEALKALLNGEVTQGTKMLHIAGQAGEQAARDWFFDPRNGWAPNTLATVRAKLRRKFKTKKSLESAMDSYIAGAPGINSVLIDTGEMRKAITHVLREEK